MHPDARDLIETLGLVAHPEGGFYRETFRSRLFVRGPAWLGPDGGRSASTAIYFLLPGGVFSCFHRVMADEVWHHYDGDPVALHTLDKPTGHEIVLLGRDTQRGQRPQHVVPGGVFQAAKALGDRYALCGCTVAPGFEFADFVVPARTELVLAFPEHAALIESLTRV